MELIFLGTGAGNGVPLFYCECKVCKEAHVDDRCRRTRCAVSVIGETVTLFDTPPEISSQLLRENITTLDQLFLTHSHHDHSAGLGDIEIYVRFFRGGRLPVFMSRETLNTFELHYEGLDEWLDVNVVAPGDVVDLKEMSVEAVGVGHAPGTLGFILNKDGMRTAYIPDTGPLPGATQVRLNGIDRLILDATFSGDNWYPDQHQNIESAIGWGDLLDARRLFLTHLSMHYSSPVTSGELETSLKKFNGRVSLAYDGMRLDLA